ncbi:M28 family metallopeptidase [Sphingomonas sp. PB2P19]|uniref:M28 family metallopeptidase n=1 Tax=Sphingomonas rhamnosi TaxID=3096156 RepID=UPI002FC8AA43
MYRPLGALAAVAFASAAIAQTLPADQAAMKAHVLFLASDAMKGREAGSPEFDIAAQYVAAQFFAAGLKPGGDADGYLQRVPLVSYKATDQGNFVLTGPAGATPLVFGTDYVPAANPAKAETSVSAPIVFVGYGIDAAQYSQTDYAGVDVRGKIVAFFSGAPARLGGEERAFFGSAGTKARAAAAHGAIATITLENPATAKTRPFARMVDAYARPRMTCAKPDGTGNADPIPSLGTVSQAGAAKLFGTAWAKVAKAAASDSATFKSAALPGTLTAATHTSFTPAASSNVIGLIPGSDPVLRKQVVVLSAHLDHIGVTAPVKGDAINNGALDNAIGIASLIEEAKRFTASGQAPKRTIMFLAVTGEEKGLVGSDYFSNHPTVPLADIAADVNLDMPILTYKFEDMIVFGAERSSLGPVVRDAIAALGVSLSPDPSPEEGIFVRSDHFRFVQKGIPSVFLWPGPKGPGRAASVAFMTNCYHKPCDDLNQPILWDQGIRFVDANYRIARGIADGPARPTWNKGDYFGTLYKGPMAK